MTEFDYFLPWTATSNRIVDRDGDAVAHVSLEHLAGWKAETTASYIADAATLYQDVLSENATLKQRIAQLETPSSEHHQDRAANILDPILQSLPSCKSVEAIDAVALAFAVDAKRIAELEAELTGAKNGGVEWMLQWDKAFKERNVEMQAHLQTRDLLRKAQSDVDALRGVAQAQAARHADQLRTLKGFAHVDGDRAALEQRLTEIFHLVSDYLKQPATQANTALTDVERAELEAAQRLIVCLTHDPNTKDDLSDATPQEWSEWHATRKALLAAYDTARAAAEAAPKVAPPSVAEVQRQLANAQKWNETLRTEWTKEHALLETLKAQADDRKRLADILEQIGERAGNAIHGVAHNLAAAVYELAYAGLSGNEPRLKPMLGFAAYQEQAMRTAAQLTPDELRVNGLIGAINELGEVAYTMLEDVSSDPLSSLLSLAVYFGEATGIYKKWRFQGHDFDYESWDQAFEHITETSGTMAMKAPTGSPLDNSWFDMPNMSANDLHAMQGELGDVLWYLAVLATAAGLDLTAIAQGNLDKLERRYGGAFSAEKSITRDEVAE